MGRKRQLAVARCPNPRHRESHVTGNGTRLVGTRHVRNYRCKPRIGDRHSFNVTIDDMRPVRWQPSMPCPEHTDGRVVRDGSYGTSKRQRYRCWRPDGTFHRFTPSLPRAHVFVRDPTKRRCAVCDEPRNVHNGAPAAARRHGFTIEDVARGLEALAGGDSYCDVGLLALRTRGRRQRQAKPTPQPPADGSAAAAPAPPKRKKRVSATAAARRRAWRIAANWVDAFAPVIWEPLEAKLRADALAERARLDALIATGQPMTRPQMILIDDKPVLAKEGQTRRRDGGFYVLVVAEIVWEPIAHTRLRLARAMPKSNITCWRLVFDELGYAPDYVVADAATGIRAAFDAHFAGKPTHFVPSLWHAAHSMRRALGIEARKSWNQAVEAHLAEIGREGGAWQNVQTWTAWWDRLGEIVREQRLPRDAFAGQRRNYEEPLRAVLPLHRTYPDLPIATGGLEKLLERTVDNALVGRSQFANIERTNALFDLVVAREHHVFDHRDEVARALRRDAEAHGGWTVSLRATDDPQPSGSAAGRYSSLRDPSLVADLAAARGLL